MDWVANYYRAYCAIAVLLICFGLFFIKIGSSLLRVIRGKEEFSIFPKPPFCLTYKIPREFEHYREQVEGWKGELPFLGQLAIVSLVVWVWKSWVTSNYLNFSPFFVAFIGFGVMFYAIRLFVREYDTSISFYREGIANKPKGGRTPYRYYEKAVIEEVTFENREFHVITFIPKRKAWLASKAKYGFNGNDNIDALIDFLKEQGLPIEQT